MSFHFISISVFEPHNIRGQMLFQNFVMLKMFLSAIVTSIVWFSILSLLPFTASKFQSARNNLGCRMNSKGVAGAGIGGAMLGIGMALSGAVSHLPLNFTTHLEKLKVK